MRSTSAIVALAAAGFFHGQSTAGPVFFPTASPDGHWFVCTNVDPAGDGNFASFKTNNFTQAVNLAFSPEGIADIPSGSHGGVFNWTFFVFRQTFDLTGFDASTAKLTIRWAADDSGEIFAARGSWIPAYTLNGGPFVYYPGSSPSNRIPTYSYSPWFTMSSGFISGLNTIDFYVQGNGQTDGFWLQVQSFTADPCKGDLNGDGLVDDADFSIFVVAYDVLDCADAAMPPGCPSDLNADTLVDDADFSIFAVAYDAVLCP
jgi:hypothetical protein